MTKSYTLKNAMATDLVNKLTAMLRTQAVASGGAPFRLSTGTTFLADERTNRVLLMGSADQHDFFDKLIETLDQHVGAAATVRRRHGAEVVAVDRQRHAAA